MEKKYYQKNIVPIILSILIIASVGISYLFVDGIGYSIDMKNTRNAELLKSASIKSVIGSDGKLKIFAEVEPMLLEKYKAIEGNTLIREGKLIIGSEEAKMMKKEGLFSSIGDRIDNLFGIDVTINGIIRKTNTIIDDMHFVDKSDYASLDAVEGKTFFKFKGAEIKTFLYVPIETIEDSVRKMNLKFSEGNISLYAIGYLDSKEYKPVIIGASEAEMMRKEKLFNSIGDRIDNLFGQDVFIAGILEKTNSSIDMMHVTPLTADLLK